MPQIPPSITQPHGAKAAPRLRVLMICAHEPTVDPRVRWEAEGAAQRSDVTVLGFNRAEAAKPALQEIDGYRIVRLPHQKFGVTQFFLRLKGILSWPALVGSTVILLMLSPLILVGEILLQIARPLLRFTLRVSAGIQRRIRLLRSSSAAAESRQLQRLRSQAIARLLYILAVLRVQFAPAAVLFWNHILGMNEKPDVVHCNDLDTLLVGALAKKNFGCRLIYDAHEFYPMSDPHGMWVDVKFFTLIERVLISHADEVVTVNPMLGEIMRTTYGLKTVYAVANVEPWVENRPKTVRANPVAALAKGRLRFLFQGRFTPERGIEEIIEAWAKVDGDKAALFLRGPENLWRSAAIDLARQLGVLDKSVYFLEAVTEEQLVEAAADADVGIVPYKPLVINDRFSCPNKLSQYLHAGLMVVANDLPYVKSVIERAGAGLSYSSADLSTLVDVVHRIVGDPELLHRCRTNALIYARETFNWQVQGKLFQSLYAAGGPVAETASAVLPNRDGPLVA